ncbi:secreted protein [Candidatus Thiomargarita nelsonii]|uniref:Secreted protein n=1 Tax=Candidatus Thiomargarita nelsonii TaxID=1003181 RepID=A0A176RSX2_9GAMM|nr:secreted protein [Candidatus Thiomargarita nelsonii]
MFSTTTMASSTTMPMASTSPNSDRLLSEKPKAAMTANVPISDTGMATIGMMAARHDWRNRMMTRITKATASKMVL